MSRAEEYAEARRRADRMRPDPLVSTSDQPTGIAGVDEDGWLTLYQVCISPEDVGRLIEWLRANYE